ncbi:right-handed parallel beta-helix repeat-containing protein [Streptomyces sp. NPDC001617]
MNSRTTTRHLSRSVLAATALVASLVLVGCGSSASTTASTSTSASAQAGGPGGTPPSGAPGGSGGQGGPGASTQQYTATGTYTLKSGTVSKSGASYTSSTKDRSAVLVTKSGRLTLTDAKVTTSGTTSSSDESSFYGLNAGVLAENGGDIVLDGGTVSTTGKGANGVFAYGSGSSVTLTGTKIKATGRYAHAVMASGGGKLTLKNVTADTTGANSATIATDRGSGTVDVTGGTFTTSGQDAPGVYSTGKITVTKATVTATGAEGAVVEGANSVVFKDSTVTGGKNGVMLHQSGSGDALVGTAVFTMDGGSLTAKGGDLFYVTNTTATITLKGGAEVKESNGKLLDVTTKSKAILKAYGEKLSGSVLTDSTSSASVVLKQGSTLKGAINKAALTLDSNSSWTVTADSTLTSLTGAEISGSKITNITGNGHTVYYDKSLAANKALGGKTYTLAGGGKLVAK